MSISTISTLQVSKFGQTNAGPILVLLHGWGSSSKIWQSCVNELSQKRQIYCVDLPGHGENYALEWDGSVDQALEQLAAVLPERCSIVGWSLGGLIAQMYADRFPQRVQSLMLIASTPKFVASEDWPHAMPAKTFVNFIKQFDTMPEVTIKQFNLLQTLHGTSAKKIMTALQLATEDKYKQSPEKIRWGLSWLQEIDSRNVRFPKGLPVYLVQGENDQVSSFQAAEDTAAIWKQVHLYKILKAGHVPFISHQDQFIEQVNKMLADVSNEYDVS